MVFVDNLWVLVDKKTNRATFLLENKSHKHGTPTVAPHRLREPQRARSEVSCCGRPGPGCVVNPLRRCRLALAFRFCFVTEVTEMRHNLLLSKHHFNNFAYFDSLTSVLLHTWWVHYISVEFGAIWKGDTFNIKT